MRESEYTTLKFTPKLGKKISINLEKLGFKGIIYVENSPSISKIEFNNAGQLLNILQTNKKNYQDTFDEKSFLIESVNIDFSKYKNNVNSVMSLLKALQIPQEDIDSLQIQSVERVGNFIDRFQGEKLDISQQKLLKKYPDFFEFLDRQLKHAKITIKDYNKLFIHTLLYLSQSSEGDSLGKMQEIIQNGYIKIVSEIIDLDKFFDFVDVVKTISTYVLIQIMQTISTDKLIEIMQGVSTNELIKLFYLLSSIGDKYGFDKIQLILKKEDKKIYDKYKNNGELLEYFQFVDKKGRVPRW